MSTRQRPAKRAPKRAAATTTSPAGRDDNTVELGSAADAPSGTALALRDLAEQSRDLGTDDGVHVFVPGQDRAGRESGLDWRSIARSSFDVDEVRRSPYGLTPVVMLASFVLLTGIMTAAFRTAGPEIVKDLQINVQQVIEISIVVGFFVTFATLFFGWLGDRTRRIPLVAIGGILSGIFGMLTGRGRSTLSLGLPKVASDITDEAARVPLFALLADYYPVEVRGKVFAFSATLRRLGGIVAIFALGGMITWLGWRATMYITGAVVVVMAIVLMVRLREPVRGYMERRAVGADDEVARTEDEPQSFGEAWRATWSIRTLRRLFLSDVFAYFGDLTGLYLLLFYAEKYGLNAWQRGLIGLPAAIASLIGGILGGGLVDRFTRRNPSRVLVVLGVYQLVTVSSVLVFALQPPLWVLILFNIPFYFGGALIGPASSVVYSQVIPPQIRTQGIQVTNLAIVPSFIIGGQIFSAVFRSSGYRGIFLLSVPFYIVAAIIAISAAGFFDLDLRSALASSIASDEWRRAKASGRGKLLVCRDICVSYGSVQVLFNVDFDVEEGEIIALLGTNGAGKSTLLRAISGTTEAFHGAVVFDGRDTTHMPSHEITARGVVHMPGGRGVFPGLSVRENLLLGNWLTDDPDEVQRRMEETFEIFPVLRDRAETLASSLSGGEQQQLSLAQAFLARPRLLMIDELSLGLSPAVVAQLLDIVKKIRDTGVTVIVVEQSVNVALTLAEKAIFMEKGEVKFFGKTADLLARPDILRAVYVKGTGALTEGTPSAVRSERERRVLDLGDARPILEVSDLVKRYGGVTAVDHVSFSLRDGEVLGLIGPNGAGKTTVFDLISGYQPPDSGTVRFEELDITGLTAEERSRRHLVRRFQDARLFPSLTVFETLLVALEQQLEVKSTILHAAGALVPNARRAERRQRVRAERLIELFELGAYRDKFVKELSTGLRRIVDVACVLATEPRVLLLDEPSSGIAQREAESLAPLLRRIRFETGCSILIIEHDMPLISGVSDELIAFDRGQVIVRGTPDEVLNDERVIESYLGTTEAAVQRSGRLR